MAFLLAAAPAAWSQDLVLSGGAMQSAIPDARSFAVGLTYEHPLGEHLAAGLGYRNEGHVPGHHRDGHVAFVSLHSGAAVPGITLAASAGPYRYFDTTVAEGNSPEEFDNAHGWGWLYGASLTWQPGASRWFWQLRIEHAETKHNLDTTLVMVGVGYRLSQDGTFRSNSSGAAWSREHDDEVYGAWGQTIVNSFESQSAGAGTLEYRHAFGPVLRGSVGWVHENDARLIRRDGITTLAWLEPSFERDRYTLGFGLGGYFSVDKYRPGSKDLLGLVATTASLRMAEHWIARFEWHRVASRHDRDSDIVLLGVGAQF
jgi:hypothetical protein